MRRRRLPYLEPDATPSALPPAHEALASPPGLLAAGGALTPDWLRHAYCHGIFPWYSAGEPILWWSPPERMVFRPDALRVPRSLRQSARNRGYLVGFDNDFDGVVRGCAYRGKSISPLNQSTDSNESTAIDRVTDAPVSRPQQSPEADQQAPDSTWIVPEMAAAYATLHTAGDAHSVEVWHQGELVGGLYGVSLGGMFWGESMFSRARDASKVALLALAAECRQRGIGLIDAQFHTPHLESLGGFAMPREVFVAEVALRTQPTGALVTELGSPTDASANTPANTGKPWRQPPESACKFA